MKPLAFRIENGGDGISSALPNYHDNLALAALVPGKVALTVMCFDFGGLHMPLKPSLATE
jgi:hypothetical protein